MKRRFATKLILSGAALAVSAATLVSTTYAWYVQNSQVTATNISGETKDNDSTSLFITKAYNLATNTATWGSTAIFDNGQTGDFIASYATYQVLDADNTNSNYAGEWDSGRKASLDPVTRLANGNFINVNQSAYDAATDAKTKKVEFNVFLKASTDVRVRPYIAVQNKTVTMPQQTAYRNIKYNVNTDDNTILSGANFLIDAVQALRMETSVTVATSAKKWDTANTHTEYYDMLNVAKAYQDGAIKVTNSEKDPYELRTNSLVESGFETEYFYKKATTYATNTTYYSDTNGTVAAVADQDALNAGTFYTRDELRGANAYYRGLVGSNPTAGFDERLTLENVTEVKSFAMEAEKVYKYTFVIWLEGTDAACFDACAEQGFDFAVEFDVVATSYVYFNLNGGSIAEANKADVATKEVELNQKTTAAVSTNIVPPTGKTFKYWSTTPDGSEFEFANTSITEDTVLYAVWQNA